MAWSRIVSNSRRLARVAVRPGFTHGVAELGDVTVKDRDMLAALVQRRHVKGHDVDAVAQAIAEAAVG